MPASPERRGTSVSQVSPKLVRKLVIAAVVLVAGLYFIPVVTLIWVIAGVIDVMRNKRRDQMVLERYFLGNGITTWLLSPFNLIVDLISYRNKGIWKLSDFPPEWQAELNEILDVFKKRRDEIIADIDTTFETGRRGMYVFTWYGKPSPHNIPEFSKRSLCEDHRGFRLLRQGIHYLPLRSAAAHASRPLQPHAGPPRRHLHRVPGRQALLARRPSLCFRRHIHASLGQRVRRAALLRVHRHHAPDAGPRRAVGAYVDRFAGCRAVQIRVLQELEDAPSGGRRAKA
jgi:hypothetical protein